MKSLLLISIFLFSSSAWSCTWLEEKVGFCEKPIEVKEQYCFDGICIAGALVYPNGKLDSSALDEFVKNAISRERIIDSSLGFLVAGFKGRFIELHSSVVERFSMAEIKNIPFSFSKASNYMITHLDEKMANKSKRMTYYGELVLVDRELGVAIADKSAFEAYKSKFCVTNSNEKNTTCSLLSRIFSKEEYYKSMEESLGKKITKYIKTEANSQFTSFKLEGFKRFISEEECYVDLNFTSLFGRQQDNPYRYMTVDEVKYVYANVLANKEQCD